MLSIPAFASLSLTFYLLLLNFINPNSALDSNTDLCSSYPCNQPPQPPSSTGYSPYGNPPPPSPPPPAPRSHCPPVPKTDCCNQPPSSTTNYPPPYPYFFTPPYPYGTLGGGGVVGGQGGGGAGSGVNGAAVAYYFRSVQVYVLMIMLVLFEAFVVL